MEPARATDIEVLFFDVLGTVVDWRGSIADEVAAFLKRHALPSCRCPSIRGCLGRAI